MVAVPQEWTQGMRGLQWSGVKWQPVHYQKKCVSHPLYQVPEKGTLGKCRQLDQENGSIKENTFTND